MLVVRSSQIFNFTPSIGSCDLSIKAEALEEDSKYHISYRFSRIRLRHGTFIRIRDGLRYFSVKSDYGPEVLSENLLSIQYASQVNI